jgi:hypothetical protein
MVVMGRPVLSSRYGSVESDQARAKESGPRAAGTVSLPASMAASLQMAAHQA